MARVGAADVGGARLHAADHHVDGVVAFDEIEIDLQARHAALSIGSRLAPLPPNTDPIYGP